MTGGAGAARRPRAAAARGLAALLLAALAAAPPALGHDGVSHANPAEAAVHAGAAPGASLGAKGAASAGAAPGAVPAVISGGPPGEVAGGAPRAAMGGALGVVTGGAPHAVTVGPPRAITGGAPGAAVGTGPAAVPGAVAAAPPGVAPGTAPAPFPLDVRAEFDLIDQTGARRRAADYLGRPLLVFFGYAGCDAICDVALPRMAAALDLLGPDAGGLAPVLITVDPEHDTPAVLAAAAARIHPRLVALTGAPERLAAARAAFGVTATQVAETPDGAPIFAHGSFVYLIGPDGALLTVLPPILSPERMAEVVRGYL